MSRKGFFLNSRSYMKSYVIVAFIAIILLVVEGSIIALMFSGSIKPDLHLIFAVCLAFLWDEKKGITAALIIGLLQDIFLGPAVGFFALSKMITAFCVIYISREMYKEQVIGPMIIVFFLTFLHDSLTFFLTSIFWNKELGFFYAVEGIFLLRALYHFILTLFIYPLLYHADQRNII